MTTEPPTPTDENPAVADLDAPVVYARKTTPLLTRVAEMSDLAGETIGDAEGLPAVQQTAQLTGAALVLAGAQVALGTAVVEQLGAVLAELRQAREDASVAAVAQAEPAAVRWSDTPRLLRMLGELTQDHHPSDARRREQLASALEDVVERWAANR